MSTNLDDIGPAQPPIWRAVVVSVQQFGRDHTRFLLLPFCVWSAFVVFDMLSTWHFSPGLFSRPGGLAAQIGKPAIIYYAWFLITAWMGYAVHRDWRTSASSTVNWARQIMFAAIVAMLHLCIIVFVFWLFSPQRTSFDVPLVFTEVFYKWFLLEIIVYFAVRWYWEQILRRGTVSLSDAETLVIKTTDGHLRCRPGDINWLAADGNYVLLYCAGQTHRVRSTLAAMQKLLGPGFYRAHRSALIRLDALAQVLDRRILMRDGKQLPVSRGKRASLLQRLKL